jgi:TAG lipase / steryl ester hydrolase / phospholipase A2 / LPA acyltransferase
MGDVHLYKHSRIGTKFLIEEYISAACGTLDSFLESPGSGPHCKLEPRNVMDQLLATRQAFGRSALLLSGGGTFGMTHIGVVKCLWESKLLPRIISGASAGSIVCSVLCTRTDEELPDTMKEFCYGDLHVFGDAKEETFLRKAARFAKYGALFDINHLKRVMRGLLGDLTFQEAYNRTRRILNISVSTASVHELPRLLNYITAPNVIIWSAVYVILSSNKHY